MDPINAYGYRFVKADSPLERAEFVIDALEPGEVVVKVAGCGLCHTDLGFIYGGVRTKTPLPLILGHEISGEVVASGGEFDAMVGKSVIVPSTLPCGECELCKGGRSNICRAQLMPGNDFDGGFASHIKVPARFLCVLPDDLGQYEVGELSVVADAVTTPYMSLQRSNLQEGDLAIVIGVGGLGTYMVQLARMVGATVMAIDIDDEKLNNVADQGASYTINCKEMSPRDLKKHVRGLVKEHKLPPFRWKVFETSGTGAGQMTAFSLFSFAGTIGIVGFTMDKVTIRLSNVMAFDGDIFGNWGCKAEYYPQVVDAVLSGKVNVKTNIEKRPLDTINETLEQVHAQPLLKRVIFVP